LKLELLKGEGVEFDDKGMLVDKRCWWDDFKVKG
jgi:methylated-DNA-[protein]-cysteine S-methyltransferase